MRRTATLGLLLSLLPVLPFSSPTASHAQSIQRPVQTRADRENAQRTQALRADLPGVRIDGATLGDAIDFIRDASGLNIHVNWRALEEVNVTRDMPVNMRLSSVTVRQVLRLLLADVGNGLLTFYAEDGVVEVTTRELADQRLVTRVYPVDDLLMVIPDFDDPPDFQIQASQAGRGGGGGQSVISGGGFGEQDDAGTTKAERGEELVQLIMETVQPDIWRENGGTASIRFFRGNLVVTAPRSVQEAIGGPVE